MGAKTMSYASVEKPHDGYVHSLSASRSAGGSFMPALGVLLIALGCAAGFFAFGMDTTVSVGSGRAVSFGLMDERRNFLMFASLLIVVGVILFVAGKVAAQATRPDQFSIAQELAPSTFPFERNLDSDQYQLYLVKNYQIEKNETLEKYVVNGRLFASIADALRHAGTLDVAMAERDAERLAKAHQAQTVPAQGWPDVRTAQHMEIEVAPDGELPPVVADWIARPKSGIPHSVVLQDLHAALDLHEITTAQFMVIRRELLS